MCAFNVFGDMPIKRTFKVNRFVTNSGVLPTPGNSMKKCGSDGDRFRLIFNSLEALFDGRAIKDLFLLA